MESSPYYQPPHGRIADVAEATGWCAVDDDGTHTPLLAWALVRSRDDRSKLVPFVSPYDGHQEDDGTYLGTFEPAFNDLLLMCGSRCEQYRAGPYFANPPVNPSGLGDWDCIRIIPAQGWCAVYEENRDLAHFPLAVWALVEERTGRSKGRWHDVVGVHPDGDLAGPDVASDFVRYSRCGTTADLEHLEWTAPKRRPEPSNA